jgi:predicted MPP superfamily phosphohydrolase
MAGQRTPEQALRDVPQQAELLVIAHEPTAIDQLQRRALVLAGHTHGGQICLPWLGPLALPPHSGGYVSGWYRRGERRMYVSRGIGTSVVPARLWCGAEVAVLGLLPGARER